MEFVVNRFAFIDPRTSLVGKLDPVLTIVDNGTVGNGLESCRFSGLIGESFKDWDLDVWKCLIGLSKHSGEGLCENYLALQRQTPALKIIIWYHNGGRRNRLRQSSTRFKDALDVSAKVILNGVGKQRVLHIQ